jgi:hypothetical protein
MNFARLFASVCAAAIVLLFALPASASAPQCDSRGAITFAPPPKLDEPNVSIDRTPSTCQLEQLLDTDRYEHGRTPAPESRSMQDVAPAAIDLLVVDAYAGEQPREPNAAPVAREHRNTLDRPPRP